MTELFDNIQEFIDKEGIESNPLKVMSEFSRKIEVHKNFNLYLNKSGEIKKLNTMKRSTKQTERRRLFVNWYYKTYQDTDEEKLLKTISELCFISVRRVQDILFYETTEK